MLETGNVGCDVIRRVDGCASVIGGVLFGMTKDKGDIISGLVAFPVNGVDFQYRVPLMLKESPRKVQKASIGIVA